MTWVAFVLPFVVIGQSRNDAGLQGDAGAVSGFFDANIPVNFPTAADSWWHLLDVRHSNPSNNYAMQFAGSFFDQQLYFRKTNGSASRPWSKVLLETDGKVGIGVSSPQVTFQVQKSSAQPAMMIGGGYSGSPRLQVYGLDSDAQAWMGLGTDMSGYSYEHSVYFSTGPTNARGRLTIGDYDGTIYNSRMTILQNGNVGIGSNAPSDKLAVNGNIRAREVKVENNNWPDYVFAQGYELPSLKETEKHIREKGHLPGIPSAVEVKANGIDLGEMNARLLQKIEEVTLHLIELEKKNELQQKEIDSLKLKRKRL